MATSVAVNWSVSLKLASLLAEHDHTNHPAQVMRSLTRADSNICPAFTPHPLPSVDISDQYLSKH